jgi:hypothetical protein
MGEPLVATAPVTARKAAWVRMPPRWVASRAVFEKPVPVTPATP